MAVEFAAVKPRDLQDTGDCVPLEDVIAALILDDGIGIIEIVGGPGAGKSTALAHLAAVLAPDDRVRLVDQPPGQVWPQPHEGLLVCTSRSRTPDRGVTSLPLAPWGDDDVIEYLLARHSHCCRSVVGRLRAADDGSPLRGVPGLWTGVLDEMAADETVNSVRQALKQVVARHCGDERNARAVREFGFFAMFAADWDEKVFLSECWKRSKKLGAPPTLERLLQHDAVKMLLAIDHVVALLRQRDYKLLKRRLPRDVVRQVAAEVRTDATVIDDLCELTTGREYECHPMAASILHAAGTRWRPARKRAGVFKSYRLPLLTGAYLEGASWPGIQLSNLEFVRVDLSGADLTDARLDRAVMDEACLGGAKLSGASLRKIRAARANLAGAQLVDAFAPRAQLVGANLAGANLAGCVLQRANLRHADLRNANLSRADLFRADLKAAHIDGADFSGAILEDADLSGLKLHSACMTGTRLAGANLRRCNLEEMTLPDADFTGAELLDAHLTGSCMRHACFAHADLRRTGLAEIDWEDVDLRDADLRGATFHMGSSRSGLVFSPLASEGTRTGFYTDDYEDRGFKSPEEIRKANLKGADLRGARTQGVDFYLVDVRRARYSEQQGDHFRRCGAIL